MQIASPRTPYGVARALARGLLPLGIDRLAEQVIDSAKAAEVDAQQSSVLDERALRDKQFLVELADCLQTLAAQAR